jgi:hypothetical protein
MYDRGRYYGCLRRMVYFFYLRRTILEHSFGVRFAIFLQFRQWYSSHSTTLTCSVSHIAIQVKHIPVSDRITLVKHIPVSDRIILVKRTRSFRTTRSLESSLHSSDTFGTDLSRHNHSQLTTKMTRN